MKPNIFAVLALLMAVGGLIAAFTIGKNRFIVPLVLAILGLLSLLLIKTVFSGMKDAGEYDSYIKIKPQFGYFLAIIGFIAAAVTAFLAGKKKLIPSEPQFSNYVPADGAEPYETPAVVDAPPLASIPEELKPLEAPINALEPVPK